MRFQIDQEKRLLPWLTLDQPNFNKTHAFTIADDTILIGSEPDKKLTEYLRTLPATLGRESLKELLSKGELCFVDVTQRPSAAEFGDLPTGNLGELIESSLNFRALREGLRRDTDSEEDQESAFYRLLGHIFKVSKAIDLVDRYITWSLVERALGEKSSDLFWLSKLLASGADQINIYMGEPSIRFLRTSRGFLPSSRANQLNDHQLLLQTLEFLKNEMSKNKFHGKLDIRVSPKMPHDRQIRFGLAGRGNLYFKLTKGADMFEMNPIGGGYSVVPKTKMDWYNLMKGNEWPEPPTKGERFQRLESVDTPEGATLTAHRHLIK